MCAARLRAPARFITDSFDTGLRINKMQEEAGREGAGRGRSGQPREFSVEVEMLQTANAAEEAYLPYGLSLLVILVVASSICIITLAGGLTYLHRTKTSVALKTRHHPVPITPYRSASLLRRDVTQTHIAGKAYTLPRRQHQQSPPFNSASPGYSPTGAASARLVTTSGDGGLTVWLGDDDVDERLTASSTARCTCTLRRGVVTTTRSPPVPAALRLVDTASSSSTFSTFKPTPTIVDASPLPPSSVADCGAFYARPLVTAQPDATGASTDYFPSTLDRIAT